MSDSVLHQSGEGERHAAGPGMEVVIKAASENTGGSLFISEVTIPPGFPGPPPHRHGRLHDMFFVVEGTLTMLIGEQRHQLGPGAFVCAPPGVVHTFSNTSDGPTRFLNFNTPGGWENYVRELAAAAQASPLTSETIGQIASRYDFEAV